MPAQFAAAIQDPGPMALALQLARSALGSTSPNPAVGAVVVREGRVVGRGHTMPPGGPHAEVVALEEAGELARGAALYVTLEPCPHQGRTPPCTDAIVRAGVAEVHVAMLDPNPAVDGRGLVALEAARIRVVVGAEAEEAHEVVEGYSRWVTTGLPLVVAKYAMSLDGKAATAAGESRWITGEAARRHVHALRRTCDAVVVGVGTALADDPQLTARDAQGNPLPRQPLRVVVDSRGRTPPAARLFREPGETIVAVARVSRSRESALRRAGARLLPVPGQDGEVDVEGLMAALGGMGVTTALVEGGGTLLASLFEARLVGKVEAFVAPVVIGGARAPTPVEGTGWAHLARAPRLARLRVRRLGDDVHVVGYPRYGE